MASWWQRRVIVAGKELSAKEYVSQNYQTMMDKELSENLSRLLGQYVSGEEVRHLRRKQKWLKEPWRGSGHEPKQAPVVNGGKALEEAIMKCLSDRPMTLTNLSNLVDRSEKTILSTIEKLQGQGFGIVVEDENVAISDCMVDEQHNRVTLPIDIDDEGWFKFGVISDTQFGSVWEQPTALNTFIHWAYGQGVRLLLHPGDVTDGVNVYKGHWLNLYARTFDEQEWLVDNRLPKLPGLRYQMIGGNHDMAWLKQHGRHILHGVCQKRDDISWLGYAKGSVILKVRGHEFRIALWHPKGSPAYSRSYKLQRGGVTEIFREFAKQNRDGPRLIAILAGHLHYRLTFSEGNVQMMQCGCFQSETPFIEELGLLPDIGGYIVNMHVNENGFVDAVYEQWRGFEPVEDDWKSWPLPQASEDRVKPVVYLAQEGDKWVG